jgi:hypothetical protein
MTPNLELSDWRILAEQASVETDGQRLTVLVQQLCAALDRKNGNQPSAMGY